MIVHLLEFRVVPGHEAEVIGFLRHAVPAERRLKGLLTRCTGRRLNRRQPELIALTCWRDNATFAAGTDPLGAPAYLSSKADLLTDRRSSTFRASAIAGDDPEPAHILRVYRAGVAVGSTAEWERCAGEQLAELTAMDGLVFVRAGIVPAGAALAGSSLADGQPGDEASVIALSAWRDWDAVLAATGGHIDRLLETNALADLERPIGVDHYELLGPDSGSQGD